MMRSLLEMDRPRSDGAAPQATILLLLAMAQLAMKERRLWPAARRPANTRYRWDSAQWLAVTVPRRWDSLAKRPPTAISPRGPLLIRSSSWAMARIGER